MEKMTAERLHTYLKERDPDIRLVGEKKVWITGFSSLDNYTPGSITWIKKKENVKLCREKLTAVVCSFDTMADADVIFVTDNPKELFFAAIDILDPSEMVPVIAHTAVIGKNVRIDANVSIGEYCCIGDNVQIGEGTVIDAHVTIYKNVRIGRNCVIKAGAVIGGAGYGYSKRDNIYCKVRHHGGVLIGDDVDIGSNTCIDCGTIDDTKIGDGVKIDNLCHIAHNARIGSHTAIVANSTVCGSAAIGNQVYIAPNAVIINQAEVEDGAVLGLGAGVTRNVSKNTVNVGFPAKTIRVRTEEDWRCY